MQTTIDFLNSEVKNNRIIITKNGMFSQNFKTFDGKLEHVYDRIGGGFTVGRTIHFLVEDGLKKEMDIIDICKRFENYLRSI